MNLQVVRLRLQLSYTEISEVFLDPAATNRRHDGHLWFAESNSPLIMLLPPTSLRIDIPTICNSSTYVVGGCFAALSRGVLDT